MRIENRELSIGHYPHRRYIAIGVGGEDEDGIFAAVGHDVLSIDGQVPVLSSTARMEILAYHSPDMLMFDVPLPLQSKGIEAYKKTWDLFFSWSLDPVVFDIGEMHITAGNIPAS